QGVTLTRIAINGFGRIGRNTLRALIERGSELEVVAINDLGPVADLARLLKFDTTLGRFNHTVETTDDSIIIDGKSIKVYAEKDPAKLPWGELDVDVELAPGQLRGILLSVDLDRLAIDDARVVGGLDGVVETGERGVELQRPGELRDGAEGMDRRAGEAAHA